MQSFLLIFALIWLISVGLWWFLSKAMRSADADKIKARILEKPKKEKKTKASGGPQQLITSEDFRQGRFAMRLLKKFQLLKRIEDLLEQAGLRWKPARMVHACLAMFLGAFMFARVFLPVPYLSVQLLAGIVGMAIPILYVVRIRAKRFRRFEELFPESLEFLARSMRAGHAFSVSLEMIHREFQEPLAGEFRRTFDEHNLGLPLDQALMKLAKRVPLLDVHFFISAVLLQKRTGGNLAEILDKLAYVIRERFKLRGKIRAISAHGRMTGIALTCIPMGVALIMFYVNPNYVSFFIEDETGNYMMGAAILLQVIGYLIIKKIVTIEV
ncbi:MAG: type II secretion system F family protein [Acidimicrobiia bacterium]|nr:type II secretion system F family protein [Acidimicrobiia bacterium]